MQNYSEDEQLFVIKYVNKFSYIHEITGLIIKNNMNNILFNVNSSGLIIKILKENIVELEPIKLCKNLTKNKSIALI